MIVGNDLTRKDSFAAVSEVFDVQYSVVDFVVAFVDSSSSLPPFVAVSPVIEILMPLLSVLGVLGKCYPVNHHLMLRMMSFCSLALLLVFLSNV